MSLILHHYPMSPFSEKIRLMFGYTGIDWLSAISPEMPPRPIVDPLAGGYRRIPVAQAGADIFCDTRLISAELAILAGKPELDPANCHEEKLGLSASLEGDIFWACVAAIPARNILRQLFRNLTFVNAVRFILDRAGVARNAVAKPMPPKDAMVIFNRHLQELNNHLVDRGPFLFGQLPTHTDFAAYHTFWFQRAVGELPMPDNVPAVVAWYQRMSEFGHANSKTIDAEQVFAEARDAAPRPVPDTLAEAPGIGDTVTVSPADYALDGTTGTLVGLSEQRVILARDSDRFGLGVYLAHQPRDRRVFSFD